MSMLEYMEQKEFQELPQRLKGADLHRAITNRDVDEIKRLIRRGVPMEVQNSRGMTPLQVVCTKKDPEMVAALLRAGCNVHATSGCLRKNAMANAAYAGDPEVFELLSNQGGSLDLKDDLKCNVFHDAILGGSAQIVQQLAKIRPKQKTQGNQNGRTPLHLAAFIDSPKEILEMTLTEKDDLEETKDSNGRSITEMAKLHSTTDWSEIVELKKLKD